MANTSTLEKTVDKTQVALNENFSYKYKAAFSGINQGKDSSYVINDIFPANIDYILPNKDTIDNLKDIRVELAGNGAERVIFDFGEVPSGFSSNFEIIASFNDKSILNDSFTNVADLVVDNLETVTATAPTVSLNLEKGFKLEKSISPTRAKPGDEVSIELTIVNSAPGDEALNIKVIDKLSEYLIPDTSKPIEGTANYGSLPVQQPVTSGSWNDQTMTFNIDKFNGFSYNIKFYCTVKSDTPNNTNIRNVADLLIGDIEVDQGTATININSGGPVIDPRLSVSKDGPIYAMVGDEISYAINYENPREVELTEVVLDDKIPSEIDIKSFRVDNRGIRYSVSISTSDAPTVFKKLIDSSSSSTVVIDLDEEIPAGARVDTVRIEAASIKTNTESTIYLKGVVNNTAVLGSKVENTVEYKANSVNGNIDDTKTHTMTIGEKSVLNIAKKQISSTQTTYNPLDLIKFELSYDGSILSNTDNPVKRTPLRNPVFIDLLPSSLEYVQNSAKFYLYDNYTREEYSSDDPDFPLTIPETEILKDTPNVGEKLVRWNFDGQTIPYGFDLSVEFDTRVAITDETSFKNTAYLGNKGKDAIVEDSSSYRDVSDFDDDGITEESIARDNNNITGNIVRSSSFTIKKQVKGDNDTEFTDKSSTNSGGNAKFLLIVTNDQEKTLKDIEIVDILPHVGDTGVITLQPRGSEYPVYMTNKVNAEVVNLLTGEVEPQDSIVVEYSMSYDPVRFGKDSGEIIGTVDDWTTTVPENITDTKSIRIKTKPELILEPYEELRIIVDVRTPVGVDATLEANNSFATRATIGTGEDFLPTEPEKVTLIIDNPSSKATVGDFVWIDNGNGIREPDDIGLNNIKVELFIKTQEGVEKIGETVTANNIDGEPGYYKFGGLVSGSYQIKFTPIDGYNLTQKSSEVNGSKADPETGFTEFFSLRTGGAGNKVDIDAGVVADVCTEPPVINAENKCIELNSEFNPLDGVTATNCDGSSITLTLADVTSNNVDTSKEGLYEVEYTVKSTINDTSASKKIYVRVFTVGPRAQAITDIIQSVALEQTALSHILNAEGEKIQKAVELKVSTADLVKINTSVESMANSISKLETVLTSKLALFKDGLCGEDCEFPTE